MNPPTQSEDQRCNELLLGHGLDIAVQPIRPTAPGRRVQATWFEVLARPRGFASPVPVVHWAASSGRALAFDLAVMRLGLRWLVRHPEVALLSFNLAPETVTTPAAARAVLDLLERSGVDPDRIAVEITESTPIRDLVRAQHLTALLRARGVRIAIDDFGAGASHMRLLAPLSIDFLKIDGAFVRGLPRADSERLFRGIVALARELGIETVAEGVETDEQHERLASAGIDYAQGFRDGGAPRLVAPEEAPCGAEPPLRSFRVGGGGA